jgi:peptidoglycan hydrolase CwlO-like protein
MNDADLDRLAEETAQRLWVKLGRRIEALEIMFEDRINDLRTQLTLYPPLIESLQQEIADYQQELQAMRDAEDRSRHDQVEAFSAMRSYRDLSERRKKRVEALEGMVKRLQQRVRELEIGNG